MTLLKNNLTNYSHSIILSPISELKNHKKTPQKHVFSCKKETLEFQLISVLLN